MAVMYKLSSDYEQAELANLFGNFKPMDRLSNVIYNLVYEAIFGVDQPVTIGGKTFLVAFVAATK